MVEELSLGDRKAVQQELDARKEEGHFMGWVESKNDKGQKEKRIFVVGKHEMFTLKPGGKLDKSSHYLDLTEIHSPNSKEATLTFKTFKFYLSTSLVDEIINEIRSAFALTFPGIAEKDRYKIDVQPESRLKELPVSEQPLGGFVETYKSLCTYYRTEPNDLIIWDLDTLFTSGNLKDFNLREFEHLPHNHLRPLLGALKYNTYFRSLIARNYPMNKEAVQYVADCVKFNKKIEELILSEIDLDSSGLTAISDSLIFNKALTFTHIDISKNNVGDKGIASFCNYIKGLNRGLVKLNLANCGIGKAGTAQLCKSLKANGHFSSTLTYFNLSNNKLEADGSRELASFLANPNAIRSLNISNTAANLDVILGGVIRGSSELAVLDLSQNKLASKNDLTSLTKLLQSAGALKEINLTDLGATGDQAKEIINAMSSNPYLTECTLNLSENKLGVPGARQIGSIADKIVNISNLNLSDNDLGDEGIQHICEGFCYNSYTKHLSLDRNFKGKGKNPKSQAIEGLINLVNSEAPIESLSLAGDGKSLVFRSELYPFFQTLSKNEKIKSLDVSGNALGNRGAAMIGKTLQANQTIESLRWDNNGTTLNGFEGFILGLKRNHTLKYMPLPVIDIGNASKEGKLLVDAVETIESLIIRNQSPDAKFKSQKGDYTEGGGPKQFGFLSSGLRDQIQKLLNKIKSTGRKVPDQNKIPIEDAEAQDHYMTNLFSLQDEVAIRMEHELKNKLASNAKNLGIVTLYQSLKTELIGMVLTHVNKSYHCLDQDVVNRLKTVLAYGVKDLETSVVETVLVEAASSQLNTKAAGAFHSLVQLSSEYLYEKVQDRLQDVSDELTLEIQEENRKKEEEALGVIAQPKTPAKKEKKPEIPKKPDLKESKKTGGSKTPSKTPSKAESKVEEPVQKANIEEVKKVEGNLEHATKSRPQVGQRRPPTRKPRTKE